MDLMGRLDEMDDLDDIIAWVQTCEHPEGGFGASEGHDRHVLYTLSAVQICALCDEIVEIAPRRDGELHRPPRSSTTGRSRATCGARWTRRFTYCALSA